MKRQSQAERRKNWADIAIDSWIRRRVGHLIVRKKALKRDPDWANKAIDAWIQRRLGKSTKSSKVSRTKS